jgi:hypothetical protein
MNLDSCKEKQLSVKEILDETSGKLIEESIKVCKAELIKTNYICVCVCVCDTDVSMRIFNLFMIPLRKIRLRAIPYLHQRPIFFKANSIHSSIVAILELIRGAQCLIEVIRSSGEEM